MFDTSTRERKDAWEFLLGRLEDYYGSTDTLPVSMEHTPPEVRKALLDFETGMPLEKALEHVFDGLKEFGVQTPHPRYYGMFNPRTSFPSILADTLTAYFNPQLAAWAHAPFAVEVERLLVREIGKSFGYPSGSIDGVFATDGQEAHITAVHCALNQKFDQYARTGLRGIAKTPLIYCSEASHHTCVKAARVVGLGSANIRYIRVNRHQQMDVDHLRNQLLGDIESGGHPFLVIATMGTTGSGAIDPILPISEVCQTYDLWLHADAAYGGMAALTRSHRRLIAGIEKADSLTFDAHKGLSVPMGASLFITRHRHILGESFGIKADYMPDEESETDALSPYARSIQWSRRFIGLKVYLPLLVFGWNGFDKVLSHQIEMGKYLRTQLIQHDWQILNDTGLPIVCFNDRTFIDDAQFPKHVYESFLKSGKAWVVDYRVGNTTTIRVCITNYNTRRIDLDELIRDLKTIRLNYRKSGPRESLINPPNAT